MIYSTAPSPTSPIHPSALPLVLSPRRLRRRRGSILSQPHSINTPKRSGARSPRIRQRCSQPGTTPQRIRRSSQQQNFVGGLVAGPPPPSRRRGRPRKPTDTPDGVETPVAKRRRLQRRRAQERRDRAASTASPAPLISSNNDGASLGSVSTARSGGVLPALPLSPAPVERMGSKSKLQSKVSTYEVSHMAVQGNATRLPTALLTNKTICTSEAAVQNAENAEFPQFTAYAIAGDEQAHPERQMPADGSAPGIIPCCSKLSQGSSMSSSTNTCLFGDSSAPSLDDIDIQEPAGYGGVTEEVVLANKTSSPEPAFYYSTAQDAAARRRRRHTLGK